jgi:hypothetical protein
VVVHQPGGYARGLRDDRDRSAGVAVFGEDSGKGFDDSTKTDSALARR